MVNDTYQQEDAQQILHLAIARQAEAGELSRVQLFEIAAELNISSADLQAAEQEWLAQRGESVERTEFDQVRRRKFQHHLVKYLIINGFFVVIDLMITGGSLTWSRYIALLWGMGLALDAWKTYHSGSEGYETAFQQWRQKRRLKRSVNNLINRWLGA
jgi:hypothetical protein